MATKKRTSDYWSMFRKKETDVSLNASASTPMPVVKTEVGEENAVVEVAPEIVKRSKKRKRLIVKNDEFEQLMMMGVSVRLPLGFSLYSTQKLIIVRILMALKNKHNVLAESPTGSGKTMALLSSTCAWLRMYLEQKRAAREKCEIHGTSMKTEQEETTEEPEEEVEDVKPVVKTSEDVFENQWIDDFMPVKSENVTVKKEAALVKQEEPKKEAECTCLPRVRIYYGTRTHKQIAQVVKEFSRLPYANIIKHTILASREQSCINPTARRQPDISQFCKDINSSHGIGCTFKTSMRNRYEKPGPLRDHLQYNGTVVFDIEQVVETLSHSAPQLCPYFCTTRILTQDADLIFCPFTYLVDPLIRNSSDVHLKNSIVILDEAHNIEDTCREAASFTFTEKEIDDSILSLRVKRKAIDDDLVSDHPSEVTQIADREIQLKEIRSHLLNLENLMLEMLRWIRSVSSEARTTKNGPEGSRTCTLSATNLFASLTSAEHGVDLFTPQNTPKYAAISASFGSITKHNEPEQQYFEQFKPSATAIVCVEKWLYFQTFFGNQKQQSTYRLNVSIEPIVQNRFAGFDGDTSMSSFSNRRKSAGPRNMKYREDDDVVVKSEWQEDSESDDWKQSNQSETGHQPISEGCKTTISLWCMSPALSFADAFQESRSIILASGTLCPMDTLKTELGMEFKQQVEGDQVISSENIFAAVIPVGPFGNRLQCTFKNTSDPDSPFYSEVGAIIRYVCVNVPAGILCFLPSYRVLEQLRNCMTKNSSMRQIEMKKLVLFEPRRSSELSGVMDEFDEAIFNPTKFGAGINGALMFAVFRGKVSEGIDFADDRARVVISVGIPFPNATDDQVTAKKVYNDQNSKTLGILSGDEWYVTQAYRALNQALGRCLRHKNDWGAMIMIDERLERQAGTLVGGASSARVSKWIRTQLKSYPSFKDFNSSFRGFMERRMEVKKEAEQV